MNCVSSEIISHFEISIENVKIQQLKLQIFKIYEYKLCALSKIQCIIF